MSKHEAVKNMALEFIKTLEDDTATVSETAIAAMPAFIKMVENLDHDLAVRLTTALKNRS